MILPLFTLSALLFFDAAAALGPNRAIDILRRRQDVKESLSGGDATSAAASEIGLGGDVALGLGRSTDDVEERYLDQRLDHFASHPCPPDDGGGGKCETRKFRQRFFYSSRYVHSDEGSDASEEDDGDERDTASLRGGPPSRTASDERHTYAFLCVGGEGPSLDKSVLVDSVHCSGDMLYSAQRLYEERGADVHLFALEHRYYGKSYPVFYSANGTEESPVLSANLPYLSSRQALADLAHFVSSANDSPDLFPRAEGGGRGADVKWATFGGSYPGMLSAWARTKLPHLVHLSVSNSAPVEARLDFREYNERVAKDLAFGKIGGSDGCRSTFEEGHRQVGEMLRSGKDEERERAAGLFNVCGGGDALEDAKNAGMFLGDGVVFPPAQGNDPHCDGEICNINKLCARLLLEEKKTGSAVEALAAVAAIQNEGENCTEVDWNKTLAYLSSPEAKVGGLRSWLWQTCSEFGFYQTCEVNSTCPYGRGFHSLDSDFEICSVAFGIPPDAVKGNVRDSLDYYGGWDIQGVGKILSVNGNVDPWSELALTPGRQGVHGRGRPSMWVNGASHHYWTHTARASDDVEVRAARENVYSQVLAWLGYDGANDDPEAFSANIESQ